MNHLNRCSNFLGFSIYQPLWTPFKGNPMLTQPPEAAKAEPKAKSEPKAKAEPKAAAEPTPGRDVRRLSVNLFRMLLGFERV